ncbi:very short patch repair endonuclease [Actinomycetospora lutea]|uniref:very short patch repair endonuclease n=1 Tax=Actinomycetospora lutea TaxID=663604 RepID=UPI00236658D6|nr:very short patch repair endonuclease [Actinomycetospora lutea]MDD7939331.1 very short patch repair endonuclease [Actinomycetospora lutea]
MAGDADGAGRRVFPETSPQRRQRMSAQRRRGTAPELKIRGLLHSRGFRYRVDHPLPGMPRRRADLLFPSSRVAVMIDGCYWHGCPLHGNIPRTNTDYWAPKIARNCERDTDTDRRLEEVGWLVVRIWEHEDPEEAAQRIQCAVLERRPT